MSPPELTVSPSTPMPKGYAFLKKGITYKTRHCRRLTQEAGMTVYVVEERKETLGIRIPRSIYQKVQSQANETLEARNAATVQRDAAAIHAARIELDKLFPRMPKADKEKVLKHAFKKHSGRVGRTNQIPLSEKVLRAAGAHARHTHTQYDSMLAKGVEWKDARRAVYRISQDVLKAWSAPASRARVGGPKR
jgi:hypothetical protein